MRAIDSIQLTEQSAPGTPSTGLVAVYAKADGLLYSKDDAGVETALGGGSSVGADDAELMAWLAGP